MLIRFKKAFTMIEVLIALAVSSIIITAAYSSYQMVSQQYKKQQDISLMHESGRAIMRMIKRDIRMAGYEFRDSQARLIYGAIDNPLEIIDSGNACCDELKVIYDVVNEKTQTAERKKIHYFVEEYENNKGKRYRLYKKVDTLGRNNSILTSPEIGKKQPLADYLDDFQLVNTSGGNYIFATDSNQIHVYDLTKPGPSNGYTNNIARYIKTVDLPDNTHQYGSMVVGPDGKIYFGIYGNYGWDVAILDPDEVFELDHPLIHRIKLPHRKMGNMNPWLGFIGNTLYVDSSKSQNPYAYSYDIYSLVFKNRDSTTWPTLINNETQQLVDLFNHMVDWSEDGFRCSLSGNYKYANCRNVPLKGRLFSTGFYGTNPRAIKFIDGNRLASWNDNRGANINFNQLTIDGGSALGGGLINVPQTQHGQHYKARTYSLVQVDMTKKSALVNIHLTLRTKNPHRGEDKEFTKQEYHTGNFEISKKDKYVRDTFSSSVLARNLAL